MKHDYAAALASMPNLHTGDENETKAEFQRRALDWMAANYLVLPAALRFADKMMQEPSEAMVQPATKHALRVSLGGDYTWQRYMRDLWVIMREQALREIEW